MPQAIGSAGSFLSGLPSAIGSFFGGGSSAPAGVPSAPTADNAGIDAGLPSSWDPSQPAPGVGAGLGYGAATPATGTPITGGNLPSELPPTSIVGDGGGGMAPPAAAPGSVDPNALASGLAGAFLNPTAAGVPTDLQTAAATGAAGSAGAADPASPWGQFLKTLMTPAGGAAGLGGIGNLVESIMRFNTMRTLQNPAALASGAASMYQPMSKALKRAIISPVTAAAQETGQINAPGLYSQSVATALAPYQYEMQQRALQDYITALQESGYAYPQGGVGGYGGSSSGSSSIFGGS